MTSSFKKNQAKTDVWKCPQRISVIKMLEHPLRQHIEFTPACQVGYIYQCRQIFFVYHIRKKIDNIHSNNNPAILGISKID